MLDMYSKYCTKINLNIRYFSNMNTPTSMAQLKTNKKCIEMFVVNTKIVELSKAGTKFDVLG